jgi:hypothetical protein
VNWEAAGVIVDFLGVVAVLASVLYLANQIRQSTAVARSAARQGIAEAAMAEATSIVDHSDLASLWYREMSGEKLVGEEDYRLGLFVYRSLRFYENLHYQYRSGMLDRDEWAGFRNMLLLLFKSDAYERGWYGSEDVWTKAFRTLVEEVRAELKETGELGTAGHELMAGVRPGPARPPGASV